MWQLLFPCVFLFLFLHKELDAVCLKLQVCPEMSSQHALGSPTNSHLSIRIRPALVIDELGVSVAF